MIILLEIFNDEFEIVGVYSYEEIGFYNIFEWDK